MYSGRQLTGLSGTHVHSRDNTERGYRYAKRRRSREGAPKRLSMYSCDICGKQCFDTRKLAKLSSGRSAPGVQIRVYKCGDSWHHTSVPAGTMAYYRELDTRRAEQNGVS